MYVIAAAAGLLVVIAIIWKSSSGGKISAGSRRRRSFVDDGELPEQARPLHKDAYVQKWAADTIPSLFDIGPKNIKRFDKQIDQFFFTDSSKTMHLSALKKCGVMAWVNRDARRCGAFIKGGAVIAGRGIVGQNSAARYSYKLEVPVTVQGQNLQGVVSSTLKVTLFVVRDDERLSISQITY